MKKIITIFTVIGTSLFLRSCENSAKINEVKIGTQTWATENLDISTFRNGDVIPEAKTDAQWVKLGEEKKPAWCYYNNDPANGKKYGRLYNWFAVNDTRSLAPKGWHIPSDAEWVHLIGNWDFLESGTFMKSTSEWLRNGNGTNASGFTAVPGGHRYFHGAFDWIGYDGLWWSSTEADTYNAMSFQMGCEYSYVHRYNFSKLYGFSIRCLKN